MKAGPSLGLTYRYAVAVRLMIQGDAFYQKMSQDLYINNNKDGEMDYSYVTAAVGADYRYISRSIFQMYYGLAAGYTFENIKYSGAAEAPEGKGFFNYQVTAVGFRIGKTLAGFAELTRESRTSSR